MRTAEERRSVHAQNMDALLSTRRLRLRCFTPDDVDLLTDLDSDPDPHL